MVKIKRLAKWIPATLALFLTSILALAAPPSGGGGGSKVSVTAANPSEATQGQELDVIVTGSGFDAGSTVSYLVTGTTDGSQVDVISVEFISSTQLKTRIRAKEAAATTDYDIEVRTLSGRKGKGTTLFRVKFAETACTGDELKEPTIMYLTEIDTSGDVYTSDIYLSSASGCDQYLLVDDAVQFLPDTPQNAGVDRFIKSVLNPKLAVRGNQGVVTWTNTHESPNVLMGLTFEWDAYGNILADDAGPWPMYVPSSGAEYVYGDARVAEDGDVVLVMTERSGGVSPRVTSIYKVFADEYQLVVSGDCPVEDSFGECYVPDLRLGGWNPAGDEIYFSAFSSGGDRGVIARLELVGGHWEGPFLIMELATGYSSLRFGSVSSTGLMSYGVDAEVISKRGKVMGLRRADAVVDLALCTPVPCGPDKGYELPFFGINTSWIWTPSGGLLFREGSSSTVTLRELTDLYSGETGQVRIEGASIFDSSL